MRITGEPACSVAAAEFGMAGLGTQLCFPLITWEQIGSSFKGT